MYYTYVRCIIHIMYNENIRMSAEREIHTQERRSPSRRADASCASFSRSGDRIL
jgi:hypothetical protein